MEVATGHDLNESIYNLLHKQQMPAEMIKPKQPRYKSTYSEKIKEDLKKGKQACRTMGLAAEPPPQPDNYLKRRTGEAKLLEKIQACEEKPKLVEKKNILPPVPKHNELTVTSEPTKKDFIALNASSVVLGKGKKPAAKQIDTRIGDSFNVNTSGLEPVYLNKKDYGKVPKYIVEKRKVMEQAQEEYEAYVQQRIDKGAMQQISDDERQTLLEGLKKNWEEFHSLYQAMSVNPDTFGKKRRKLYLESEMSQLEKDIALLEGHPVVFIVR